jgi:hypothetical protein
MHLFNGFNVQPAVALTRFYSEANHLPSAYNAAPHAGAHFVAGVSSWNVGINRFTVS